MAVYKYSKIYNYEPHQLNTSRLSEDPYDEPEGDRKWYETINNWFFNNNKTIVSISPKPKNVEEIDLSNNKNNYVNYNTTNLSKENIKKILLFISVFTLILLIIRR